MTYQSKYHQNQRFIQQFMNYLPEINNYDDRLKLICEIARLKEENQNINQMSLEASKQDYPFIELKIPSYENSN